MARATSPHHRRGPDGGVHRRAAPHPQPAGHPRLPRCVTAQERVASDAVRVSAAVERGALPRSATSSRGRRTHPTPSSPTSGSTGQHPPHARLPAHHELPLPPRDLSFEAHLTRVLDEIRGRAVSCEFAVDADPSRVDPARVNVNVTTGSGGATVVPRDVDHNNGWDLLAWDALGGAPRPGGAPGARRRRRPGADCLCRPTITPGSSPVSAPNSDADQRQLVEVDLQVGAARDAHVPGGERRGVVVLPHGVEAVADSNSSDIPSESAVARLRWAWRRPGARRWRGCD